MEEAGPHGMFWKGEFCSEAFISFLCLLLGCHDLRSFPSPHLITMMFLPHHKPKTIVQRTSEIATYLNCFPHIFDHSNRKLTKQTLLGGCEYSNIILKARNILELLTFANCHMIC